MRQSIIQASILAAASTVLAAPFEKRQVDASATVILGKGEGVATLDTTFLTVEGRISQGVNDRAEGPFSTLEVSLGADANPALRCAALDVTGKPIAATRGDNFDISFSDADKGAWTFDPPAMVDVVLCDVNLVGKGFDVNVTLSDGVNEPTITTFANFIDASTLAPMHMGPFNTIEVNVGVNAKQDLRCSIKDTHGMDIVALRGTNTDTTFSDADKGAWTFQNQGTEVSSITCNPMFVANSST